MNRFAWASAHDRRRSGRRGVDTVAEAMLADQAARDADVRDREGRRHRSARSDEGGPAARRRGGEPARSARPRRHRRGARRRRAHRRAGDAGADSPRIPLLRQRYPALADAAARVRRARKSATSRRSAAICCSGRAAGISARPRIIACARAAAIASRFAARTSTTRCSTIGLRHRASLDRRHGAGRARRQGRAHRRGGRGARRPAGGIFSWRRTRDMQRENDLRPHEILTAVRLPPPRLGARMAHHQAGQKNNRSTGRSPMSPSCSMCRRRKFAEAHQSFSAQQHRYLIAQQRPKPH